MRETSVDVPPMSKLTTLGKPAALARGRAPTTPPAGPGQGGPDRLARGLGRGDVALVRLHDPQVGPADAAFELAEVAVQDRHEVGVDGGRRGPLVLAVFGKEPLETEKRRPDLLELLRHDLLVRGIGIGVDKADGHGFRARLPDRAITARPQLRRTGRSMRPAAVVLSSSPNRVRPE